MSTQGCRARECHLIKAFVVAIVAAALGGPAFAQGPPVATTARDPYFIVLCTDVSGSMNENDPLYRDQNGRLTTLRDDAQLTFLALLGECPVESFVGACRFTERITGGLPGGTAETVAFDDALLPWRSVGSDWESLRDQLSTRRSDAGGTRIETALGWARRRINIAREKAGRNGHGIVVLLSDGDPDRASGQLNGGAVLDAAGGLASEDIQVYSIIVNKASYRSGRGAGRLNSRDAAAEQLMEQIARMTQGGTYRITPTFGLLQIFLDIFRVVPTSPPIVNPTTFDVSRHHRTVVFIGPVSPSISIGRATPQAGGQTYLLPIQDGLDEVSGIDRKVIPLAMWNIVILRRPPDAARRERYWCGTWRPAAGGPDPRYAGRVYLITDFLLHLTLEPQSPAWANEQIRVAARVVERPRELGERVETAVPLSGGDLALSFLVNRDQTATPLTVGVAEREASGRVFRSESFQVDAPGRYTVICECVDRAGGQRISLGKFSTDLAVEPAPLSLVLRRVSDGEIVFPRGADPSQKAAVVKGGDEIYGELRMQGGRPLTNMEAQLYVSNAPPAQHPFAVADARRLVTGPVELPRGDIRLTARATVLMKGEGGTRQLSLPGDFLYDRGDLELISRFSDDRKALWVGEYHKQLLHVSVFPVFMDSADAVAALFPRELSHATMAFYDAAGGDPRVVPIRCTRETVTRERQQNALKITATYTLELPVPIPPAQRCEIDPGPVLEDLTATRMAYDVVDPAQRGMFAYRVGPTAGEEGQGPLAETLVANEPVVFRIERAPDQNIREVVFEFREQGAGDDANTPKVLVSVPGSGATSRIERSLQSDLRKDTNYDVYVHATLRPEGSAQDVNVRLQGGSVRAVERYLELQQLVMGAAGGADLSCRALETIEIPLQARFTGYRPGNPDHSRLIAEFKDSCRLVAVDDGDRQQDASMSIQWTKAQPPASEAADQSYLLEGFARYAANVVGRHRLELTGEIEVQSPGGKLRSVRTVNCRLFAQEPRFRLRVQEITPRVERVLFDSERLVLGGESVKPARNSYATQLRVLVDFPEASAQSLKAGVSVKRRNPSENYAENVLSREIEFKGPQDKAELVVDNPPLEQAGEYFLQFSTAGSQGARVDFTTPVLLTIADATTPQEIVPPRGFLTSMVRQWPFSYAVPIQPSWSFDPIDLRFEFQFAGMGERWFAGVASADKDRSRLIVQAPDYLPGCDDVEVGPMRFRLRYMGADRVTWESASPVQVVSPCLAGVDLVCRKGTDERPLTQADRVLKPPFTLRARPRFRSAAELQGWWSRGDTKIWIAKTSGPVDEEACTSPEYLGKLTQLASIAHGNADHPVRLFRPEGIEQEQSGVEILREGASGKRFWGLPRFGHREAYLVLASASYEEKLSESGTEAEESPRSRVITEWAASQPIIVEKTLDIPYLWWALLGMTGVCVSAQVTRKRLVPAPERLGLSIHLRGDAVVKPARLNPTVADLEHETSWSEETQMYAEYLASRHPGWGKPVTRLIARPVVALSRLFRPRRRLWISVRPEVDRTATHVQTALMCVWTGIGRRRGVLWSSRGGVIDLPDAGQAKEVGLNLAYRVGGDELIAPVTVFIRRA